MPPDDLGQDARSLVDLPDPADILFVDEAATKWKFFDTAAVCAFYSNDKPACKRVSQRALLYRGIPEPDRERILKNVSFC